MKISLLFESYENGRFRAQISKQADTFPWECIILMELDKTEDPKLSQSIINLEILG